MLIDCDSCEVRGLACGDCVVTVLLGASPGGTHLDPEERRALDVLAASGLVPPLRLVMAATSGGWSGAEADAPIPYAVAYNQPDGAAHASTPGPAAADTG